MESWQKKNIKNNLVELIEFTSCSTIFLARLETLNMLHAEEIENLVSIKTPTEKSKKLYEILLTRVGSYNVLIQCLEETKQSGAYEILKGLPRELRSYGDIVFDKNRILGTGSYGTVVYKGTYNRDKIDKRDVAVKVVNFDLVKNESVLQEIQLLINLDSHENIVRYFAAETNKNRVYIALELCIMNLEQEVAHNSMKLDPELLLYKCTKGVGHLHKHNVIHGDLKPANILITAAEQVKIADFGMSKKIPDGLTSVSVSSGAPGTLDWMAPEIMRYIFERKPGDQKLRLTASSDVFSLGCIYYYVLSKGSHPFGHPAERQYNIYNGREQVDTSKIDKQWMCCIGDMVSHHSQNRPSIRDILSALGTRFAQIYSEYIYRRGTRLADETGNAEQRSASINAVQWACFDASQKIPTEIIEKFNCGKKLQLEGQELIEVSKLIDEEFKYLFNYRVSCQTPSEDLQVIIDRKGEKALHVAVSKGNLDAIEHLLKRGMHVNKKDSNGDMPLHYINLTNHNFKETVDALLKHGADINAKSYDGTTPLSCAAHGGKTKDQLSYMIENGADWKMKNTDGLTPLHLAVDGGSVEGIGLFVELGIHIESKDIKGNTPFHRIQFTEQNFKETVDALLKLGADINAESNNGTSPLSLAAMGGKTKDQLSYMIENGADWEMKNINGSTALHFAVDGGNIEGIGLFVELGIHVHSKNIYGNMAFHRIRCTKDNFKETVDALLNYDADINAEGHVWTTPLSFAAMGGKTKDQLSYMIENGADWEMKNINGSTALHFAVGGGNAEGIGLFVELGIHVHSKDINGNTAFHHIRYTKDNFKETVDALLKYGADINAKSNNGTSPLSLAAMGGKTKDQLSYMIENGADWKMKNIEGLTALHFAVDGGNVEAIGLFVELGIHINSKDINGNMPFHRIQFTENLFAETVDALLKHGADINAKNYAGNTPFRLASLAGNTNVELEYLIGKGADRDA